MADLGVAPGGRWRLLVFRRSWNLLRLLSSPQGSASRSDRSTALRVTGCADPLVSHCVPAVHPARLHRQLRRRARFRSPTRAGRYFLRGCVRPVAGPGRPRPRAAFYRRRSYRESVVGAVPVAAADEVITRAISDSPNLASARATLAQAEEVVVAARGAYYPQVNLATQGTFQNNHSHSGTAASSGSNSLVTSMFNVGPVLTYTPDLFGQN